MNNGILIEELKKRYGSGDSAFDALKNVNMQVEAGEVVGAVEAGAAVAAAIPGVDRVVTVGTGEIGRAHV